MDISSSPRSDDDFVSPAVREKTSRASTQRDPLSPASPNRKTTRSGASSSRRAGKKCRLSFGSEQPDQEEEDEEDEEKEEEEEEEEKEVPTAKGESSEKPKCGGGNPWAKKIKKPITIDTNEELSLHEIVTDLETGVTTTYDGRMISEEIHELEVEYAQSKADRPEPERSLFGLIGQKGALTTEQRLSVAAAMRKPELGRLLRDIEASAPEGLNNSVVDARVMLRPVDADMDPHRDSINLKYDRSIFTWLTGPSVQAPEFFIKLTSGPDATPARGPYEPGEIVVPKVNGRVVVKGPNARGEQVRAVHGVRPGKAASLTLVADYITITGSEQPPASDKDRERARKSVVAHTTRPAPPGATISSPFADRLVWPENAPLTPGSRRATEANNALVLVGGKMVKKASVKANSCNVADCPCKGGDVCTCVGHNHVSNASAGGAASSGVDCNQVGAGPNLNKAAKLRRDIPNDVDNEGAGSSIKRERGMCLGLDAKGEGFQAKLKASIDLRTGRILPHVQLCSKPHFDDPRSLTLGRARWQMDERGDLVLGYHNTNKTADHPSCQVGGTVPAVEVGGEWVVPEWAIWFISRGKGVLRVTNSKRHH